MRASDPCSGLLIKTRGLSEHGDIAKDKFLCPLLAVARNDGGDITEYLILEAMLVAQIFVSLNVRLIIRGVIILY